jgi:hypothetical protein
LSERQQKTFVRRTAVTAFNKVIRILPEVSPEPPENEDDCDDCDLEQDCTVSRGRCDWKLANASEDAMIARIDARANEHREPEPTEYEQAVTVLGAEDAAFYWNLKTDAELYRERSEYRTPRTRAAQKRFERLSKKLCRNSSTTLGRP